MNEPLFIFVLRLADDHLMLGHRLSEWCGHAPMLEEDLALPNMALDLIGQARSLYDYAGKIEGKGRGEDDLAYLRYERHYLNCLMVERENGDFGHTILRQLFFAAFMSGYWRGMEESTDETLRAIAGKASREVAYHLRHCGEWTIRLGDGTAESHRRMEAAVEALFPYVDELFEDDEITRKMAASGVAPNPSTLRAQWFETVGGFLAQAKLQIPDVYPVKSGGRRGLHSEAMGHLLAELQYMQRTFPGAQW